jgi:hypothetical protein
MQATAVTPATSNSKDDSNSRIASKSRNASNSGNASKSFSYLAGMSPYISLKIKKRHYEHHMIEAHK